MNARRNRGGSITAQEAREIAKVAKVLDFDKYRDHPAAKEYEKWHWGIPPVHAIDWPDADYPDGLVACGRMIEFRVRMPGQRRSSHITLSEPEASKSFLAYDSGHPAERLYVCASPAVRQDAKARFWTGSHQETWNIEDLAAEIGGRHATNDYPDVEVKPIGVLTDVVYAVEKKGDGFSHYIHACGEESKVRPVLAVDSRGRFWVVGGNYTAPHPGITD